MVIFCDCFLKQIINNVKILPFNEVNADEKHLV